MVGAEGCQDVGLLRRGMEKALPTPWWDSHTLPSCLQFSTSRGPGGCQNSQHYLPIKCCNIQANPVAPLPPSEVKGCDMAVQGHTLAAHMTMLVSCQQKTIGAFLPTR